MHGPAPIQVTIDCKTTEAGILQRLMVQIGAVVKPGQAVASISAGAAAAHALPAPAAAAAPSRQDAGDSTFHGGRMPGIHFPARRTAGGERISDLPAAKQDQILGAGHAAPAPTAAPASAKPAAAAVAPPAAPVKAKVSTTILTEVPARRQLTVREVELINSGGA